MYVPTEELYNFAKNFSENFQLLGDDVRSISSNDNYCIDYKYGIFNSNKEESTAFFRTVEPYGKIEINKKLIKASNGNIKRSFVFFAIIWCAAYNENKKKPYSKYIRFRNIPTRPC